ncbi:DNA internalization-related competence protein ComEC/Rec2 [Lederbergia citrea]|uniref:DNA internalization-related competence protein ComEC/Rec2 n=1 Tax=Lederbergia citrea TaxID=2833581 RepID=UPI001BC96377|nr:DNA internalization-related competence protein ComEC/Rec2 [Lederbergia citrea]MBS4202834.1 DNA internalization-related competence protein ComEC/Rec2 [Lederbergia citrea]
MIKGVAMVSGKWIYLAAAALSGILMILELHVCSFIFILLVTLRILLEKDKWLFVMFCVVVVLFIMGALKSEKEKTTIHSAGKVQLYVTFKEVPNIDGNRLRAVVSDLNEEKLILTNTIQSEPEKTMLERQLRAGGSCLVSGELIQPGNNRNEHAFNYQRYLFRQNIHWQFQVNNLSLKECDVSKLSWISKLQNLRAAGINHVEENFPATLIPYANALIFGDRTAFSEDAYRAYQKIGVVHLLAISGLHIGFLVGGIYFIFLRLGLTKETVFWLLVSLLPVYAVVCGANPPVIRAVIMTLILMVSKKWRLPLTTLDAFSISFIVFLFFDPYLIYHAGFQLSYCVSLGLIVSSKYLLGKHVSLIQQMANISVISTLTSLPILAFHFYEFSIISIVANIIFVPFYTAVVLPAMLFLYLLQFFHSALFSLLAGLISKLVFYSEQFAKVAGSLKFSMLLTGKPGAIGMVCMIAGSAFYLLLKERGKSLPYAAMPLFLILLFQVLAVNFSPKGEVIFIDVGQGDSILIKLPYNRGTYLIDTGGQISFPIEDWQKRKNPFHVGEDIVLPLLKSKGISKLDKVILTHSDMDHMGAAQELLEEISIKEIIISKNSWQKPLMSEFITSAKQLGIMIREEKAGTGWENKSGKFHFIFPFGDEYKDNNSSLVLYGVFGGMKWLFTGDVEKEGEGEMIKAYNKFHVNVLKVGHHGSKSSTRTEFLEAVTPEYAIISAGKNNRYGHPHPEVMDALQKKKINIFQTSEEGAVHYIFSKKGGTFKTILQYDKAIQDK